MKKSGKIGSKMLSSLTRAAFIWILALWLIAMLILTSITAEGMYSRSLDSMAHNAENAGIQAERIISGIAENTLPGYREYALYTAAANSGSSSYPWWSYSFMPTGHISPLGEDKGGYNIDSSMAVIDPQGNILAMSGNYICFPYLDAAGETAGYAVILMDQQFGAEQAKYYVSQLKGEKYNLNEYFRFTGVLNGAFLTVKKVEVYPLAGYTENPEWRTLIEYNTVLPEGAELVSLTARTGEVDLHTYNGSGTVKYQGQEYQDLNALLEHFAAMAKEGVTRVYRTESNDFAEPVTVEDHFFFKGTGEFDENGSEIRDLKYVLLVAARSRPVLDAAVALTWIYLATLILALIGPAVIRSRVKKHILAPVAAINEGVKNGFTRVRDPENPSYRFREIEELVSSYERIADERSELKSESIRLERAAKYAQEAEQNRRQLTSNMAHELKTPLAIISSYAEGLQEHIAEEKREKYLEVILDETARMDGMVLEMLDLSRLEAGKVKLVKEDFSLTELTYAVFERLSKAAEVKGLKVALELGKGCIVNADRQRIEQVITNFAVNAVKYTPNGGSILVRTFERSGSVTLTVENDSPPLSNEALAKVWDSFYRADESRTGRGTGLGLAIAKSIIDLHGGECSVRNTKTGVEFRFTI